MVSDTADKLAVFFTVAEKKVNRLGEKENGYRSFPFVCLELEIFLYLLEKFFGINYLLIEKIA